MPAPLYTSVERFRALGMDDEAWPDETIEAAIVTWQSFIERACRQWFYPKELELRIDGTDSDAIHFGVPIISIEEVRINNSSAPLPDGAFRVYSTRELGDRSNPRIKLLDEFSESRDIYTAFDTWGARLFRKGRQNQYVKGVFGYVEDDGSPPPLIVRALEKLVVEKLSAPIFDNPENELPVAPPGIRGIIIEEWTDMHRMKYADAGGPLRPRAAGLTGITLDPEILGILKLFKAPLGAATPASPSYR